MSPFWRSLRPFSNFFSRYHFHNQNFCSKMRKRIFNYPIWVCEADPVKLGKGADQYACKFDRSDDELRALLVTTYQRSKIGTRKHWLYEIWTPGGANSTSRPLFRCYSMPGDWFQIFLCARSTKPKTRDLIPNLVVGVMRFDHFTFKSQLKHHVDVNPS